MLKDYFIQKLKLRSNEPVSNAEITKFLKQLDATIKSVDKIVEKKIQEYLGD